MKRFLLILGMMFGLAACGAEPVWAPDDEVQRWTYVHDGPPTITLFTVISNNSGTGAHAALMINGAERILFDPAGTWHHPQLPERDDVHFGIQPQVVPYYIDYHARITYHVIQQDLVVSPQVAAAAIRAAKAYGAVAKAHCTVSVSYILREIGFTSIPQTYFPKAAMEAFAQLPGVREQIFYDDDAHANGTVPAPRLVPQLQLAG